MDNDFDGKTDSPNIKPILFDTAQAAFLAGYASASYSTAKKVGTFGGMNFPTVTIFMDGFAQGVDYWNAQKKDTVQVVGWDSAAQNGSLHGRLRRQPGRHQRGAEHRRPGRRRAAPGRRPDLPERGIRHPQRRS